MSNKSQNEVEILRSALRFIHEVAYEALRTDDLASATWTVEAIAAKALNLSDGQRDLGFKADDKLAELINHVTIKCEEEVASYWREWAGEFFVPANQDAQSTSRYFVAESNSPVLYKWLLFSPDGQFHTKYQTQEEAQQVADQYNAHSHYPCALCGQYLSELEADFHMLHTHRHEPSKNGRK